MGILNAALTSVMRAPWMKRAGLGDPSNIAGGFGWSNGFVQTARNSGDTGDISLAGSDAASNLALFADASRRPAGAPVTKYIAANGSLATQTIFIATRACKILSITEIHTTAGTNGSAVTLNITKETGTQAPGAGVSVQTGTFDMKGTASTLQTAVLSGVPSILTLAAGDRLSMKFTGTLTTLAGVTVTVMLSPGGVSTFASFSFAATPPVSTVFFLANKQCTVQAVKEIHSTKASGSGTITVDVVKCTSTQAIASGTSVLSAVLNVNTNSSNNTVQSGSLSATASALDLQAGDRLAIVFAGTLTALAGVALQVQLSGCDSERELMYYLQASASIGTDTVMFVADRDYEVIAASELHAIAGTSGFMGLEKEVNVSTTGPGAGSIVIITDNTNKGFDGNATANTVQVGTLAALSNRLLAAGDRLSVAYSGTIGAEAGLVIAVSVRPR